MSERVSDPKNEVDIKAVLKKYIEIKADYDHLAEYLKDLFSEIAAKLNIYPIIQGRAKSLESLAEKIQRTGKNYKDPIKEITDFCGVRFITHTLDEVDKVTNVLTDYFNISEKDSEDKQEKLAYKEFGYLSRHYIITLRSDIDRKVPPELLNLNAELQLRTMAQHIWADIYHELGYKNEFQLPERWERNFARVAALLENLDDIFQTIKNEIGSVENDYGAYMSNQKLTELAKRLEILLEIDENNVQVLQRLVKAYVSIADQKSRVRVERIYRKYKDLADSSAPILRMVGMSMCKNENHKYDSDKYNEGLNLLKEAINRNTYDVEALCNLGGIYFKYKNRSKENLQLSRDNYKKAHNIKPEDPYPLNNYIACEILLNNSIDTVEYFNPLIKKALKVCRKQIEVKTNLPWALYDTGMFNLYLNKPEESLEYYAKALKYSSESWMAGTSRSRIEEFISKKIVPDRFVIINNFLKTGEWVLPGNDKSNGFEIDAMNPFVGDKNLISSRILIIAGGCGNLEENYKEKLKTLSEKINAFDQGTVISGGTKSGVAEIAGDLQKSSGNIYTIGYLPPEGIVKEMGDEIHPEYKYLRYTKGKTFSFLEPVTFWLDFLSAGGNPESVKLIGFNGGKISGCEYAAALAFGARVGIIKNSGRKADELLKDSFWKEYLADSVSDISEGKNLFSLDIESDDVERFLKIEL